MKKKYVFKKKKKNQKNFFFTEEKNFLCAKFISVLFADKVIILHYHVYRFTLYLSWTMIEPIIMKNQGSTGA